MSKEPNWKKSSFCDSNGCLWVAVEDEEVLVTDGHAHFLRVTPQEWQVFVAGVKNGEFDM